MRLALVYENGIASPIYGATTGSPKQVGEQIAHCASRVGWDDQTKMHGVGDGASWIANQFEERFGANGAYLIDLFHFGEYLALHVSCTYLYLIKLLRTHGIIKKVGHCYKYCLTKFGRNVIATALKLKQQLIVPDLCQFATCDFLRHFV